MNQLLSKIETAHKRGLKAQTRDEYTAAGEKAIRLLPEIRAELMALYHRWEMMTALAVKKNCELDLALAELERMKSDAERYRWLLDNAQTIEGKQDWYWWSDDPECMPLTERIDSLSQT